LFVGMFIFIGFSGSAKEESKPYAKSQNVV
jgi:hypothetical protein